MIQVNIIHLFELKGYRLLCYESPNFFEKKGTRKRKKRHIASMTSGNFTTTIACAHDLTFDYNPLGRFPYQIGPISIFSPPSFVIWAQLNVEALDPGSLLR